MSAQIIVLAERRLDRPSEDALDASLDRHLAAVPEEGSGDDPYGLVAAVRALAANMERMRERSTEMRKTCQSLADAARAVVTETGTISAAVEQLSDVGTSLVHV